MELIFYHFYLYFLFDLLSMPMHYRIMSAVYSNTFLGSVGREGGRGSGSGSESESEGGLGFRIK